MNKLIILKKVLIDFGKGIISGIALIIGLMIGGIITNILNIPMPALPAQAKMEILMPLILLTGILLAIILGKVFQKLYYKYWQRLIGIFLCFYLGYYLLNTLDGMLYYPLGNMQSAILSNIFPSLAFSAIVALLWKSKTDIKDINPMIDYFSTRKPINWLWRIFLACIIYPAIYYLIGLIVSIFTLHYYQDSSLNLGLVLPKIHDIIIFQFIRGPLFLISALTIIIPWRKSKISLFISLGLVIFIQISSTMIIQGYWLPLGLRIPHSLELLIDSFLQSFIYVILLYSSQKQIIN